MNNVKLPLDVEFYEDIRLIVWRPRGLVNKVAVNKIITVLGELETALKEPFNRFSDTVAADAVDLNFEYITHGSPINARVFQDRKEAAQWLGVPIAILLGDANQHQ